jgi:pyrroline-5-carboxylate reductase
MTPTRSEIKMTALSNAKITFVGAGSMAEAIFRGLLEQHITSAAHITVTNRQNVQRLLDLESRYGVNTVSDSEAKKQAIQDADIVFLTMKPKDVIDAFAELKPLLSERQLLISVIAGLTIDKIQSLLGANLPIIRTMPNTSCTIGLGATGIAFSSQVNDRQQELGVAIFEAVGIVSIVREELLEIVTGLSGSGPAYIYYFMEAMIKAGIEGGLAREEAHQLTLQTLLGAAQMVKLTGEDPQVLRRKVTSPNGATQASIEALDAYQFTDGIIRAVFSSAERSKEMGDSIAVPIKK